MSAYLFLYSFVEGYKFLNLRGKNERPFVHIEIENAFTNRMRYQLTYAHGTLSCL